MDFSQLLLGKLNRNTQVLLNCGDDAGPMKLAVDHIYKIYSQITGAKVDTIYQDKDIKVTSTTGDVKNYIIAITK